MSGFHPELTGRENIFMNGAILGLSKRDITKVFDDIVAFAELDKFIDMQVRHYSSGMYVRLGFAVAVNVDPDILLVDEVLAVGDERSHASASTGSRGSNARAARSCSSRTAPTSCAGSATARSCSTTA